MDALDLGGSRWVAVEVGGRAALANATPNAAFEIDGRVYGSTGVNRFSSSYSLVGDELTMGQAVSTMMAGPPEAMAQEQIWLHVLSSACRVRRDGELLVIDDGANALVLAPDEVESAIEL